MAVVFLCLTSLILVSVITCSQNTDVKVTLGFGGSLIGRKITVNVSGSTQKTVHTFLGIPFAKPPIGKLRFAEPLPVALWANVRDAKTLPKTCWQFIASEFDQTNLGAKIWVNNTEMDEDCLYLNVWTAATLQGGEKLPVMVWIYGGGFFSGTSTLDVYNGLQLAAREDVIVVSMQYRVGAFGFLYLGTKGTFPASGNMGLLDQQLALKWVHENIRSFGGDPQKVTIFGESAGSSSVGLHFLSPGSRPYFSRMIMQSAGPMQRWSIASPSTALDRGNAFIRACNCSAVEDDQIKRIDCLQALPASVINNKIFDIAAARLLQREDHLSKMLPSAWPTDFLTSASSPLSVDLPPVSTGRFLPKCPEVLLQELVDGTSTTVHKPSLLIGNVNNEGMFWLLYGLGLKGINFLNANGSVNLPTHSQLNGMNIDISRLLTDKMVSTEQLLQPFAASLTTAYGLSSPDLESITDFKSDAPYYSISSPEEFMSQLDEVIGDLDFVCGTKLFAEWFSRIPSAQVFYYNFVHKTKGNNFPDWTGAMHGYEIEYIFGMPFSKPFTTNYYEFTSAEEELSARMMKYWTTFAKTGDVNFVNGNATNSTVWPKFNLQTEEYLEIGLQQKVKSKLHGDRCQFLNKLLPTLTRGYYKSIIQKSPPSDTCPNMEFPLFQMSPLISYMDDGNPPGGSGFRYQAMNLLLIASFFFSFTFTLI